MKKITDLCQEALTISDSEGNLPLHFACKNGHTEVIKTVMHVVSERINKAEENDAKKKEGKITEDEWHVANLKTSEMRHSLAAMYVSSLTCTLGYHTTMIVITISQKQLFQF